MENVQPVWQATPTDPLVDRNHPWFRLMRIKAERRHYADRPVIGDDAIIDLKIDLALSRDVWDVSGRPE